MLLRPCVQFGHRELVVGVVTNVCTYDYPEADMKTWEQITKKAHERKPVPGNVKLQGHRSYIHSTVSSTNLYVTGNIAIF